MSEEDDMPIAKKQLACSRRQSPPDSSLANGGMAKNDSPNVRIQNKKGEKQ